MPNSSAMVVVQAKVFTVINVAAITNLFAGNPVVGVYDVVPEGKPFPYVELGEVDENPDNTFGKNGRTLLVSLHIFSEYQGYLEVEKIIEALNLLLDQDVSAPGTGTLPDPSAAWHVIENFYESGSLQKEFDAVEVRHAIARYRINVQQT